MRFERSGLGTLSLKTSERGKRIIRWMLRSLEDRSESVSIDIIGVSKEEKKTVGIFGEMIH